MNQLTKFLVDGILNEGEQRVIAAYGGGFKPPTAGHFEVVKQALKNHPEIDEFIIYVGSGTRDGITQAESVLIWEIYQTYLPMKVKIEPSKAPIGDILRLGKNNPQDKVYFVLGAREENEGDFEDIKNRTRAIGGKHPNVEVKVITTADKGMSGTNARKAAKVSFEDFAKFLPTELSDDEKETVYNIVKPVVKESLDENASYSQDIDIKQRIMQLTQHMLDKGMNIEPLPNVKFVDGDKVNAREFLGKTAYYDPNSATIVLYTEGRHPKDIVRSFSHEMIHHIQNLEGRLGNITTTNTQEDDTLNDIEAEANLKGTMTFRNWTDSLNESKQVGVIYHYTTWDHLSNKPITKEILFEEEDKLMVEVVNPDGERFEYEESNIKGLYTYKDSLDNLYFARITYSPSSPPRFEFKVGWFEDNDISKPKYDPQLPPNTTSMDDLKRRNTVAKIYRDEILPYLKDNQKLAKQLDINPISQSRYIFSQRLIQHHTPSEYNIDLKDRKIVISLPKIEEKKNKDPFGLNAYALELAKGLEEEIDKDKKNENVAPNHDGKAAPYGSGYKKLNEGRYDTLANQLSKIAFQEFKDIHDRGDEEGTFKFRVDHPDEEHDIPAEEFYFDFEGIVKITDDEYNVDGGANVGFDDKGDEITPILSVKFKIPKNPDWQKVSFDIKDVVRHELEHLTQDGDNEKGGAWHEDPRLRRPSKYMQDDQFLRNLIDANLLPKSDYFKLEKEVDAMLQGMYFKAKKSKTPFKKVLNDYLDIFVDQGSISKEEKENILDVWRSRRKALSLPSF